MFAIIGRQVFACVQRFATQICVSCFLSIFLYVFFALDNS